MKPQTSIASLPQTIHELYNHPGWDGFIGDRLGNDLFINDPERAERIHDAAENGADGSTHAEHIQDWRDFMECLRDEVRREPGHAETEAEGERLQGELDAWEEKLSAEIDACEAWHETNGSLHSEIG